MRRAVLPATVVAWSLACGTGDVVEPSSGVAGGDVFAATTFPATAEGACSLQAQCGCTGESYESCVTSLGGMSSTVYQCIVAQDCTTFCAGGGVACVNADSEASRLGHELRMDIINNYPTGGACSAGQREVRDVSGAFLYCQ